LAACAFTLYSAFDVLRYCFWHARWHRANSFIDGLGFSVISPEHQTPTLSPKSAEALLVACGQSDKQAFEALYSMFAPRLMAVALRLLGSREAAEDVLQESFVAIWRKAADYQPNLGSAIAWMTVVVRHRSIDRMRTDKSRRQDRSVDPSQSLVELVDERADPFADVWVALDGKRLRSCLDTLGDGPKQALLYAYFDGLTHEETAVKMQSPLGTVKSWVRRSLTQLRKCLEP
jgi:RNA polymerase sigma-70 factor, ECF subfamily